MTPRWQEEPISREPSPEERASEGKPKGSVLSAAEQEALKTCWRRMRLFKPQLYRVLKAWVESLELRDESSGYTHRVYRGWYAEQAKRLRLTENGVKVRLRAAQKWLAERFQRELGEGHDGPE